MPASPTGRTKVAVRLAQSGVDHIDALAAERGIDRSEMVRRMLGYAAKQIAAGRAPELARGSAVEPIPQPSPDTPQRRTGRTDPARRMGSRT